MKKITLLILILVSIVCAFSGCKNETVDTDTSTSTVSSEKQATQDDSNLTSTVLYDLPTTDELVERFETYFTLSNMKRETGKVAFNVSTGETIFGFTKGSAEVTIFQVFVSGSDVNSLLSENYHFYPFCHFISGIKGETVTVSEIIEILMSKEPKVETSDLSNSMAWKVKKEGIEYELVVTEYVTINYCTMNIYARTNGTGKVNNSSKSDKVNASTVTTDSSATATSSKASNSSREPISDCSKGHSWKEITKTVQHKEEGHYEKGIVDYSYITVYVCPQCSQEFYSYDQYATHFDTHIQADNNIRFLKDSYKTRSESEPVYGDVWVVDKKAYTETVVDGYECTVCGTKK